MILNASNCLFIYSQLLSVLLSSQYGSCNSGGMRGQQATYLLLVTFAPFSPILQAPVHILVSLVFLVQNV
jgi:hypothetical protein